MILVCPQNNFSLFSVRDFKLRKKMLETNVSFFITLPDDWVLTFGSLNKTYEEVFVGDSLDNAIAVTIPSGATTGERYIFVNATGVNSTGGDLSELKSLSAAWIPGRDSRQQERTATQEARLTERIEMARTRSNN